MGTAAVEKRMQRESGGSFLIEDLGPQDVFTPEDLSPEQRQIAEMTANFAEEKILPRVPEIEAKNFAVSRELMREAGELGLLGVDVPEEYGGLELDKVTSALIAERIAVSGSFSVTFSAHAGIGTLPLMWYGTPEQKAKYLPKIASGEWIAAYALSESSAGSDAMNIRTHAKVLLSAAVKRAFETHRWSRPVGFAVPRETLRQQNQFVAFFSVDARIEAVSGGEQTTKGHPRETFQRRKGAGSDDGCPSRPPPQNMPSYSPWDVLTQRQPCAPFGFPDGYGRLLLSPAICRASGRSPSHDVHRAQAYSTLTTCNGRLPPSQPQSPGPA